MRMTSLSVEGVGKTFGGFRALTEVSLRVSDGERRAIIGPNGAGKSTLFNLIGGQIRPTVGRVRLDGEDVTGLAPYQMWGRGLTRTFQRNSIFAGLTAEQNIRLSVIARRGMGFDLLAGSSRSGVLDDDIRGVLHRVGLTDRYGVRASDLAYGEQRQLELAVALAGEPRILLLDEPTAGMSPAETEAMIQMLRRLPREICLLIVEHDMDVVFALADSVTVMHMGTVLAEGTPAEVHLDERVIEVYLNRPKATS